MDDLGFDDLRMFARVAALGTLSAVARERDVPVSQVSRALLRIEKSCAGRLVQCTVMAQYLLLPSLGDLGQRYPRLCVELEVSDRLFDMARDGIDIAIRMSVALPETMVARQIDMLSRALCAARAEDQGLHRALGGVDRAVQRRLSRNR
jgi:DNA-binding transcriptional LysR family regulator